MLPRIRSITHDALFVYRSSLPSMSCSPVRPMNAPPRPITRPPNNHRTCPLTFPLPTNHGRSRLRSDQQPRSPSKTECPPYTYTAWSQNKEESRMKTGGEGQRACSCTINPPTPRPCTTPRSENSPIGLLTTPSTTHEIERHTVESRWDWGVLSHSNGAPQGSLLVVILRHPGSIRQPPRQESGRRAFLSN